MPSYCCACGLECIQANIIEKDNREKHRINMIWGLRFLISMQDFFKRNRETFKEFFLTSSLGKRVFRVERGSTEMAVSGWRHLLRRRCDPKRRRPPPHRSLPYPSHQKRSHGYAVVHTRRRKWNDEPSWNFWVAGSHWLVFLLLFIVFRASFGFTGLRRVFHGLLKALAPLYRTATGPYWVYSDSTNWGWPLPNFKLLLLFVTFNLHTVHSFVHLIGLTS